MSASQPDTKQRILTIAGELFARQGYTGTTIADIARELGTTTAALYYHFPSKAAILGGLLAGPLAAYTRLLGSLDSGQATPEDLLGAIIDLCVESRELAGILDRDPAALAMIDEQLPRSSAEITAQTVAALAGPAPDRAALIRANAALAVAKAATLAAMRLGDGKLEASDRAEVLAIAMRALKDLSRTYGCVCQTRPHGRFRGAVDQGTTSTRFMVFDHEGSVAVSGGGSPPGPPTGGRRLRRLEESGRPDPQLGRCRLISACQQAVATRGGLDDGRAQAGRRRTGRRRDRGAR